MRTTYNPFNKKTTTTTRHGTINYQHDMGTIYLTHRRKEHYFIKYKGFGISNNELETCYQERVHWIIIIYHNEKEKTSQPYRITLKETRFLEQYQNKKDNQTIIPKNKLEKLQEGQWIKTKEKH